MAINQELLKRITVRPDVFGGKPIIRDMRISVELILSLLAQGETLESIMTDYPDLEPDDILACPRLARYGSGEPMKFLVDLCAGRRLTEWLQGLKRQP
jgi:uncharacterized protein (DUF433 family)